MAELFDIATVVAVIATAGIGGVFFGFAAIVMPGLARLDAARAVATMKAINVAAVRPLFMGALVGTALLCTVLAVRGVLTWGDESGPLLVVGAALYAVGTIGITIGGNVPLNETLARSSDDAASWRAFAPGWIRWNWVRAALAAVSALCFVGALLL
jgi:uncharacterized membrane protein